LAASVVLAGGEGRPLTDADSDPDTILYYTPLEGKKACQKLFFIPGRSRPWPGID
jgi:hypothetical protein